MVCGRSGSAWIYPSSQSPALSSLLWFCPSSQPPPFCCFVSFVDYHDLLHCIGSGDFVCHQKQLNCVRSCDFVHHQKNSSSFFSDPSHCPAGSKKKDKFWIPLSEQAVTLIYRLADQPDSLCGDLIHRMAASLLQETQVATDSQEGGEWAW